MADTPRSSFIPKQTSGAIPSTVRRKKKFHVFGFLAGTLLVGSLGLAAGVYFYNNFTISQLESEREALALERDRFNESDIQTVQDFERRLNAAALLLDQHLAPSKLFTALELSTQDQIQFLNLTLEQQPSNTVSLEITGGTEEFKTLALQQLQFAGEPTLEETFFSDIAADGESAASDAGHRVTFSITGSLPASTLLFEGGLTVPTAPAVQESESSPEAEADEEGSQASENNE